jgi:hypothetical protein
MVKIVDIRTSSFSDDDSDRTTTIGFCSSCRHELIEDYSVGFPATCPNCDAELEFDAGCDESINKKAP